MRRGAGAHAQEVHEGVVCACAVARNALWVPACMCVVTGAHAYFQHSREKRFAVTAIYYI